MPKIQVFMKYLFNGLMNIFNTYLYITILHMTYSLGEGICESLLMLFQCETPIGQISGHKTQAGSSHEDLKLWLIAFSFCISFLPTWVTEHSIFSSCGLNVKESYSDSRMEPTHWNRHRKQRKTIHPKLLMKEPFISRFQSASETGCILAIKFVSYSWNLIITLK